MRTERSSCIVTMRCVVTVFVNVTTRIPMASMMSTRYPTRYIRTYTFCWFLVMSIGRRGASRFLAFLWLTIAKRLIAIFETEFLLTRPLLFPPFPFFFFLSFVRRIVPRTCIPMNTGITNRVSIIGVARKATATPPWFIQHFNLPSPLIPYLTESGMLLLTPVRAATTTRGRTHETRKANRKKDLSLLAVSSFCIEILASSNPRKVYDMNTASEKK